MTQGYWAEKTLFLPLFQLCLNVRTQICVLIISICNAAGCWGSHSQFLSQRATTARTAGRNTEEGKAAWRRARENKKVRKSVTVQQRALPLWAMTATSDALCFKDWLIARTRTHTRSKTAGLPSRAARSISRGADSGALNASPLSSHLRERWLEMINNGGPGI